MNEFSTTLRYLAMLEIIPRQPNCITVSQLISELERRGYLVDKRTVQRDLGSLEVPFGLSKERISGRQNGWSFASKVLPRMFPSMDEHTALSFQLVKEYLQPLFPPETLKMVDPWFVMSGKALASRKGDAARWQEKLFVRPPGPSRVSPRIRNKVQEAVYHAVLHEQGLKISYLPRGAKVPKSHLISPLGLVVREHIVYLVANFVATQSKPEDQFYLPLHRIQDASTEGAFRRPEGFNLREYAIERMGFPMGESKTINLVLRLDQRSAVGVSECPISERQSLEAEDDGFVLKAVVPNTLEIRQWIRSMGQCAEVLEPGFLREEFKEEAAALAKRYRRGNPN